MSDSDILLCENNFHREKFKDKFMKKKIFIDFDGVLNTYNGWKGDEELFKPLADTKEFLKKLSQVYEVYVFTTRERGDVCKWLIRYHLDDYIADVTNKKEPAYVYIDDRAVKFNGDYTKLFEDIENFKPHWK